MNMFQQAGVSPAGPDFGQFVTQGFQTLVHASPAVLLDFGEHEILLLWIRIQ
jgi:hypothetical protein